MKKLSKVDIGNLMLSILVMGLILSLVIFFIYFCFLINSWFGYGIVFILVYMAVAFYLIGDTGD